VLKSARYRFAAALICLCGCLLPLDAKIFLLLDERLKKSAIEQVIYKFVPLTNASEVELQYVTDFLRGDTAAVQAAKFAEKDRAFYIGQDKWPEDSAVKSLVASSAWPALSRKIVFILAAAGGGALKTPPNVYEHRDLWRKYAEATKTVYSGFFNTHYLDATPKDLKGSWPAYTCVHESGSELLPTRRSPLKIAKNRFHLLFQDRRQLAFLGTLVCINSPRADTIFEVQTAVTDVALTALPTKFSAWNEAQPLAVTINTNRQITSPMTLQVIPETNATQTEFFYQGDRIVCTANRCTKKNARFLLPLFTDHEFHIELAVRAAGDSYFRGQLRLMSGEVELARTAIRVTPHSWVAETLLALRHPSEYQRAFLLILFLTIGGLIFVSLIFIYLRGLIRRANERRRLRVPTQSSASCVIREGDSLLITATKNPFGCVLSEFGGIVTIALKDDMIELAQAGKVHRAPANNFSWQLPDGYRVSLKSGSLLEVYRLSLNEKGS